MRRQGQQHGLLLGQDLSDGPVGLIGMATLVCDGVAPGAKLRVQIVEVAKGAGREEGVAQVLDLALDFSLGESRQLQLMRMLRDEFSGSPIRSTR